jgi:hypothetical protein
MHRLMIGGIFDNAIIGRLARDMKTRLLPTFNLNLDVPR